MALLNLEENCWQCDGDKNIKLTKKQRVHSLIKDQTHTACPNCDGKGVIITSEGQQILDFVRKHGIFIGVDMAKGESESV